MGRLWPISSRSSKPFIHATRSSSQPHVHPSLYLFPISTGGLCPGARVLAAKRTSREARGVASSSKLHLAIAIATSNTPTTLKQHGQTPFLPRLVRNGICCSRCRSVGTGRLSFSRVGRAGTTNNDGPRRHRQGSSNASPVAHFVLHGRLAVDARCEGCEW